MKIEAKSLELAKLMGWKVKYSGCVQNFKDLKIITFNGWEAHLSPYSDTLSGLAQFAFIILKFPHYVDEFHTETKQGMTSAFYQGWWHDEMPTQEKILDAILRINGIEAPSSRGLSPAPSPLRTARAGLPASSSSPSKAASATR